MININSELNFVCRGLAKAQGREESHYLLKGSTLDILSLCETEGDMIPLDHPLRRATWTDRLWAHSFGISL